MLALGIGRVIAKFKVTGGCAVGDVFELETLLSSGTFKGWTLSEFQEACVSASIRRPNQDAKIGS